MVASLIPGGLDEWATIHFGSRVKDSPVNGTYANVALLLSDS